MVKRALLLLIIGWTVFNEMKVRFKLEMFIEQLLTESDNLHVSILI